MVTLDSWSSSLSKEVDGSTSHTVVTDLIPLTTYDFRVFAVNALGKSEPSKVISITTDEEGMKWSQIIDSDSSSAFSHSNLHR